jgi:2-polyprenyl-6-methoxyphenol hydroxylase-like FAD-dependent oxidoreductase
MRRLGVLDPVLPHARQIRQIQGCFSGRVFGTSQTQQYGISYSDMVNALRASIPADVQFRLERVVAVSNSDNLQRLKLSSGAEICSRLVVMACGLAGDLPVSLGLKRVYVQRHQSVALGFNLARDDGRPFSFDSVTYYSISPTLGIDYLSLFPTTGGLRANLFAFPSAGNEWVRQLLAEPEKGIDRCFPKLRRIIGEFHIPSKVEASIVHLYRTENQQLPGVVLIGDAAENVCPATGMGLSKIFTDVHALSTNVPGWFATAGMHASKTAMFCTDPEKVAVDTKALRNAFYRRQAATGRSLKWRLHRARLHWSMRLRPAKEMAPSRA